jgi:hypothetical protein
MSDLSPLCGQERTSAKQVAPFSGNALWQPKVRPVGSTHSARRRSLDLPDGQISHFVSSLILISPQNFSFLR